MDLKKKTSNNVRKTIRTSIRWSELDRASLLIADIHSISKRKQYNQSGHLDQWVSQCALSTNMHQERTCLNHYRRFRVGSSIYSLVTDANFLVRLHAMIFVSHLISSVNSRMMWLVSLRSLCTNIISSAVRLLSTVSSSTVCLLDFSALSSSSCFSVLFCWSTTLVTSINHRMR
jgi:hypothetical protein